MAAHTVKLPDGRSVQFPASMSDQDINEAVANVVGQSSSAQTKNSSTGAPKTQPSGTSADPSSPSLLSRAGKFLNTGLASGKSLFNAVANGGNAMADSMDAESGNYHDPTPPTDYYSQANQYANAAPTLSEINNPTITGIKYGS